MKNKELYRQVALKRLSSPEELDSLMQVTSPKGWLALGGIAVLLVAAGIWSIAGRVPTKLVGQQCIMVKNGGVNILTTSTNGRLSDLAVEVGDTVARGQIIGRLEQADLLQKVKAGEARLSEMEARYTRAVAHAQQDAALRDAAAQQQTQQLTRQMAAAEQKRRLLEERIKSQAELLDAGLITRQTLINSQLELTAAKLEADTVKAQVKQLELTRLEAKRQSENELVQVHNQLEDVRREMALMGRETKSATAIISPYSGKVLEIRATEGQLVERGTQLVSIESTGSDVNELEAYIYLPAADGKKVERGMTVEISPSTARREEYGFLPAYVATVAEHPSTHQGLMRVFGNDKLVQQLTGTLAPIQIMATLKPSAKNVSHYEWSTREGPPFALQSGTSCSAAIKLSERRPIELLLPMLKKFVGAA